MSPKQRNAHTYIIVGMRPCALTTSGNIRHLRKMHKPSALTLYLMHSGKLPRHQPMPCLIGLTLTLSQNMKSALFFLLNGFNNMTFYSGIYFALSHNADSTHGWVTIYPVHVSANKAMPYQRAQEKTRLPPRQTAATSAYALPYRFNAHIITKYEIRFVFSS